MNLCSYILPLSAKDSHLDSYTEALKRINSKLKYTKMERRRGDSPKFNYRRTIVYDRNDETLGYWTKNTKYKKDPVSGKKPCTKSKSECDVTKKSCPLGSLETEKPKALVKNCESKSQKAYCPSSETYSKEEKICDKVKANPYICDLDGKSNSKKCSKENSKIQNLKSKILNFFIKE